MDMQMREFSISFGFQWEMQCTDVKSSKIDIAKWLSLFTKANSMLEKGLRIVKFVFIKIKISILRKLKRSLCF